MEVENVIYALTLIYNDCQGKFVCSDCCRIFHKHPSRKKTHQPVPLSDDRPQQTDQHSDEESMHNHSFDITDSPSIHDTFQETSKVCVLAETFANLTQFHKAMTSYVGRSIIFF